MTKEQIRQAIIDLWKKEYGDMKKELDEVGVYFITGFVLAAIDNYNKNH